MKGHVVVLDYKKGHKKISLKIMPIWDTSKEINKIKHKRLIDKIA